MFKARIASKDRSRLASGFTLVEIIIIVALIGSLAAIAANSVIRARNRAANTVCISNLEQIARAKSLWAIESKVAPSAVPVDADLFGADKFLKTKPTCPMNGSYTLHAVSDPPECSNADHVLP